MANRGRTWEVPAGDGGSFNVTAMSNGAAMVGIFAGSETLAASVNEGSTTAAIAGVLTCSWKDATNGIVKVVVNGSATSGLAPGYYKVKLEVTYSGAVLPFYYGWLRILPVPGSTPEPPTYISLQQLQDYAGDWLPTFQQGSEETNFLKQRARARSWLDEIIVSRSRVFALRFDLTYALYYASFPFGPVECPDQVITTYLANNDLIVRDRTIEINAYKSLAYICEKRISFDEDGEAYRRRGAWYHAKASQALRGYRCEIDTNADGTADIAFNLGVISMR